MPAETGNLKTVDENPRRNGLFSIDDGLRGSGRLDGGVRSQIRTGLSLTVALYREYLPIGPDVAKRIGIRGANSIACKKIP
jgi:hypothetical protein